MSLPHNVLSQLAIAVHTIFRVLTTRFIHVNIASPVFSHNQRTLQRIETNETICIFTVCICIRHMTTSGIRFTQVPRDLVEGGGAGGSSSSRTSTVLCFSCCSLFCILILIALCSAIPVTMIVIGTHHRYSCPIEPRIPIYLVCMCFSLPLTLSLFSI
jgi:hypothetical protein